MTISSLPPIFAEASKHRMRRVRIKTGGGEEDRGPNTQISSILNISYQAINFVCKKGC